MANKNDKEVIEFLNKNRRIVAENFVNSMKKIEGYDKDWEDDDIRIASEAYDKENSVNFKNHRPFIGEINLFKYINMIKDIEDHEEAIIIGIDKEKNKIIDTLIINNPDKLMNESEIIFVDFVLKNVKKVKNFGMVWMHNHPHYAVAKSSKNDIWSFMRYSILCNYLGAEFMDSFIVTKFDIYSERQEDEKRLDRDKIFPVKNISKDDFKKLSNISLRSEYLTRIYLKQVC